VSSGTTSAPSGSGAALGLGKSTPYGYFGFAIAGATPNSTVTVTITVPAIAGQTLTGYEKCGDGGCLVLVPMGPALDGVALMSVSDATHTLTLSCKTDATGRCQDPGAPVTQASGGGGGGAFDWSLLAGLAAMAYRRRRSGAVSIG